MPTEEELAADIVATRRQPATRVQEVRRKVLQEVKEEEESVVDEEEERSPRAEGKTTSPREQFPESRLDSTFKISCKKMFEEN